MKDTAIIIPTRLKAKRFPNKPLAKINNIPMIIHVLNRAKESKVGEVFVATSDSKIIEVVKKNGGTAIVTKEDHFSGSDRVHEAYVNYLKDSTDLIINLQGDMPNIKPDSISKLEKFMRNDKCEIGTLASLIENKEELSNVNAVKVLTKEELTNDNFVDAKDFFRIQHNLNHTNIYHHVGIYAFTNSALTKYVKLSRSRLEKERSLEQMRAMENNMSVKVAFSDSTPLGVDTERDLNKVAKEMK